MEDNAIGSSSSAQITPESPQQKRLDQRALEFIKEWGGVATVLIAILYTFPFEVFSRVVNWRDRNVIAARLALTQVEELAGNKVLALKQVKSDNDAQEYSFLSNTFAIRIYNIMVTNREIFNMAIDKLSASELYAIGSNFALSSGVEDSLPFFAASIEKSKDVNLPVYVTANRELGAALSYESKYQDIPKSREAYRSALELIAKKENKLDPSQYAVDLSELAFVELSHGDWKCGIEAHAIAHKVFDKLILRNPQLSETQRYFDSTAAALTKLENQPTDGCSYAIPKIDWL